MKRTNKLLLALHHRNVFEDKKYYD